MFASIHAHPVVRQCAVISGGGVEGDSRRARHGLGPATIIARVLKIGSVQLDFPVVQAALAGYSDAPMRLIARRMGAPYAMHEVVLDQTVVRPGKKKRLLFRPLAAEDHPIGGQLMGAEPGQLAEAAGLMASAGYDVLDLNFGCPVKKVLGRCRGGYLLSDPPTAIEIMRVVREAVPREIPVTVKMRRGMDASAASESGFFRILDAAFELGLAAATIHPRTVRQRYVGPSDWGFLTRVKCHVGDRTILGSGDLFGAPDIARMLKQTGVDGVALARGCIGNPWLFRDARELLSGRPVPALPAVPEQGCVIRAHYELSVREHGERLAGRVMRKFAIKYAELHPYHERVRAAFVRVTSCDEWLAALDEWYAPDREWPPGRRKSGPGDLVAAGAER